MTDIYTPQFTGRCAIFFVSRAALLASPCPSLLQPCRPRAASTGSILRNMHATYICKTLKYLK
jgi:hypothetical protein